MSTIYRCQFCGLRFHDEDSWNLHTKTCFSRTTTCSLCGLTMPTAHKEQHLRVVHNIGTSLEYSPTTNTNTNTSSTTNSNNNNNNNMNNNNNTKSQFVYDSAANSTEAVTQSVFPIYNPNFKVVGKSSALSKVAARSGLASNDLSHAAQRQQMMEQQQQQSFNNHNNNSNNSRSQQKRSKTPPTTMTMNTDNSFSLAAIAASVSSGQQQPNIASSFTTTTAVPNNSVVSTSSSKKLNNNTNRSTTPTPSSSSSKPTKTVVVDNYQKYAHSGFSFKSNQELLNYAGSPQRKKEYQDQIDQKMKEHHHEEEHEMKHKKYDDKNKKMSQQQKQGKSVIIDFEAQKRLQLVEDVVHNIMTHSPTKYPQPQNPFQHPIDSNFHPQRDQFLAQPIGEASIYSKNSLSERQNHNKNDLGLLKAAATYAKQPYTPTSIHFAAAAVASSTSQQQQQNQKNNNFNNNNNNINEEFSLCPDCGKAIHSMEKHRHCQAESTACPKCGQIIALLQFDRHFIQCAIPGWASTRERIETDRMLKKHEKSVRKNNNNKSLLATTSASSRQSFSMSNYHFGNQNHNNNNSNINMNNQNEQQSLLSLKNVESFVGDNNKKLTKTNSFFADFSMGEIPDVDDDENNNNPSSSSALHSHQSIKKQNEDSFATKSSDRPPPLPTTTLSFPAPTATSSHQQKQQVPSPLPPGFRPCVLCNKPIKESELAEHLDTCDSNLLSCPLCMEGVPSHQMENHQVSCVANRRRCFHCNTSVQFSHLADHVNTCCAGLGTMMKLTMYHGTSEKAAREIIKQGFLPSANGTLGEGVYMSRDVQKAKNYGSVIIEAIVSFPSGKIITIPKTGHRLQKCWQRAAGGYDAAWMPQGVSKSGMEEHCIKNPNHISVVKIVK